LTSRINRRRFLLASGGSIAAVAVAGAAYYHDFGKPTAEPVPQIQPTLTSPTPTAVPTETARPTGAFRSNTYLENGKSLVSAVKGNAETEIEAMVRKSVNAIGGISKIVTPGKKVVVKPAVLASSKDCAPDPRVVAAVVKLAKEAGGIVVVADSSGVGGRAAYNMSQIGITSAAESAGAEVKDLDTEKDVQVKVPNGLALREVQVYPTIRNCDVLINVPRLKRHSMSTVTISLKNLMGTVPTSEKHRFHGTDLSQCIADLNTVVRSDLTVVDATEAMTRTGPTNGDMVKLNTIFASGDPVAVDRIAAQELQNLEERIGVSAGSRFKAAEVRHILAAADRGVGTFTLDAIKII
jgi:uncharacterized protein (DUF362 family)